MKRRQLKDDWLYSASQRAWDVYETAALVTALLSFILPPSECVDFQQPHPRSNRKMHSLIVTHLFSNNVLHFIEGTKSLKPGWKRLGNIMGYISNCFSGISCDFITVQFVSQLSFWVDAHRGSWTDVLTNPVQARGGWSNYFTYFTYFTVHLDNHSIEIKNILD